MKRALIFGILALAACRQTPEVAAAPEDCSFLPQLEVRNAVRDAVAAFRRPAPHFLAVRGFTVEVPGVAEPTLLVRLIEGTSDYNCLPQNWAIRDYAQRYNVTLDRLTKAR